MSEKKKNLLLQGGILAGAGLITKIIGFAYRIPMSNMMGDQGNGLYSVAFGIYGIALTISSYSLPLAVSKMVSARIAKAEYQNMIKVVANALVYALIAGLFAMNVLFFGAGVLEKMYHKTGLALPLRVLAPTTFVVALLGVFRGFFQGHGDMVPTSLSQILEQIVNAVISVFATWWFTKLYAGGDLEAAFGAAGGTLGTLAGALSALLFILFLFIAARKRYMTKFNPDEKLETSEQIYKALFLTIIPIILSQTIYQIGYTIDDLMFGSLMEMRGYKEELATSLQGVFNTQYNQLVNLPVAIATAMASSTLPSIVLSRLQNDTRGVHQKITQVIKVNMVIAFPSAVGLAVLSEPIIQMLFPRLTTYRQYAIMLLATGSSAVVFYALSTLTTSVLQGSNYMRLPVIHSAVSLGIHVVLLAILLLFTDLGVYALLICNGIFPVIVSVLNCRSITQKVGYKWEYRNTFIKPMIASAAMGIVAFAMYHVLNQAIANVYIVSAITITASIIVYGVMILQINCFSEDELRAIPGGSRLVHLIHN
ncbi:MAG: polysaccharide biosynthesis protein [Eubacterium sp.]|nr:polysaccharide biosynthesis protein [Eubacterium sp.]